MTKQPDNQMIKSTEHSAAGLDRDPFAYLGPHPAATGGFVVRAIHPAARSVQIRLPGDRVVPMTSASAGVFEAHVDDASDYRLRILYHAGHVLEVDDPYRYGRVLTDFDLHLLSEGTHHRVFEKLGSHRINVGTTTGVHFAVWAPNADRVSLIGDYSSRRASGRSSFPTCQTANTTSSKSGRRAATS
jgi:1,4-alpha-glucan branching enzyme